MADKSSPKRPASPRAETMQEGEAKARLTPHYLPDYNRSVLAEDAAHAAELAKKGEWGDEPAKDDEVTEDKE